MATLSNIRPEINHENLCVVPPPEQLELFSAAEIAQLHDRKSQIIQSYGYNPMPPERFFIELYGDEPLDQMPYTLTSLQTWRRANNWQELLDIARVRNDILISPCWFKRGYINKNHVISHLAMVIDIDDLDAVDVDYVMRRIADKKIPRPTWVVNSGGGIHLYYVYAEAVTGEFWRYQPLLEIKRKITALIKQEVVEAGKGKIDMLAVIQGHRVPGSLTKKNQIVLAMEGGPRWSIRAIADIAGIPWPDSYTADPLPTPTKKPRQPKRSKITDEVSAVTVPRGELVYMPRPNPRFFESCRCRLWTERRHVARRQNALFALAIVGYKCGLSRAEVLAETTQLAELFNAYRVQDGRDALNIREESVKWMNGYNPKYVRCTAARLAEFFGWDWSPTPVKRNGRKQAAHLKIARATRNARISVDKAAAVQQYRAANPDASQRQCRRDTKMSRDTIAKYWND